MWGWLPGRVLSGSLNGSGPAGGCSSRKAGWLTVSREACFSRVGLVAWCVWCKTRPLWWAAGAVVVVVVCWWWVPSRAWCAWGWHAVGVLGQCALVAWPVFCCLVWVVGCGCGWVGCELYSGREHLTVRFLRQNCFLFCSCVFVVCFFERSVDALASGADEGRGGLRYSSGSRLAGCDPRVSEWGDPARVMSCHLHLNCIGCGG